MPVATVTDRSAPMTRAFVWSLVLHALVVVVAALPVVHEALAHWHEAARQRAAEVASPPSAPVELEVVVPEITVVRPPPTPAESFIRTDGLPVAKPDPGQAKFISDRDTRAASTGPPDPSATESQPNQEGIDLPVVEVIRKEQSDGEDESLAPAPDIVAAAAPATRSDTTEANSEPPAPPAAEEVTPAEEAAPTMAEAEAADPPVAPSVALEVPAPVEDRLALARESEMSVAPEREKAVPPPPSSPSRPRPKVREPEVASRPPTADRRPPARPAAPTPPAGFSGLRVPTRLRGTISNQGPASIDAEDTPTGRYMKQVTGAIEKEWHRKRRMHRDFVTFGTIKLEFHVNPRGEVQNLTIKSRSGANAVMQDFTLNAVLDASIPPMPNGLSEILDQELLLISYDIIVY